MNQEELVRAVSVGLALVVVNALVFAWGMRWLATVSLMVWRPLYVVGVPLLAGLQLGLIAVAVQCLPHSNSTVALSAIGATVCANVIWSRHRLAVGLRPQPTSAP